MTDHEYYLAINQAHLDGCTGLAESIYRLYKLEYPNRGSVVVGQCVDIHRPDYVVRGVRCGDLTGLSK